MALGQHHAHFVLQTKDGAEHVGVESGRIGLGGLLGQWPGLAFGTGAIHGDIQATKTLDGLVDEIAHVVLVPDVRAHEFRLSAKSAQFSDERLPSVIASTGNDDARTFLREPESHAATYAGEASRDYDNPLTHS